MQLTKLLTLLMLSFILAACGRTGINGKKTISLNKAEINKMLSQQTFECASLGGACPEGIARVFILNEKNPDKSSVCTGFLNGNNRLVTNNHCISTLQECKSTYISLYGSKGNESLRCKSIVKTENDKKPLSQKSIDYTVLELDRSVSNISPFPLSRFSPYEGERLTSWVIDHMDRYQARITELSCTMSNRRYSLELKNCPAIHGNSGSPIVNDYGEVVAVIWGSTVDEEINEKTPLSERRSLSENGLSTELKYFRTHLKK